MALALQDRVFVVTGGFGSLGRALGSTLEAQGARVALLDRTQPPALAEDTDRRLLLGAVDLGAEGAAQRALARVVQRWQRIDGLVNVAGGFAWETLDGGSLETWDRLYAMNLRSAVAASLPSALSPANGAGRVN